MISVVFVARGTGVRVLLLLWTLYGPLLPSIESRATTRLNNLEYNQYLCLWNVVPKSLSVRTENFQKCTSCTQPDLVTFRCYLVFSVLLWVIHSVLAGH